MTILHPPQVPIACVSGKTDWLHPTAFCAHGEEERRAMARVLASGRFTMGVEVEAFEAELAEYLGRRYAVMVNSGSSANLLAVAALSRKYEMTRHASVPAIAWSTTYAPLVQQGIAYLHLNDVDATWNAPPSQITRLNICVPVLGNPAHMDDWAEAIGRYNAVLMEDACESLGAVTEAGVPCGTVGHVSTLSFFYSHQLSAIEGGAVVTDDDAIARHCLVLRAHGWTREVSDKPPPFDYEYEFVDFGYNLRPLEMHAAVAREQLKKLRTMVEFRRANLSHFSDLASTLPVRLPEVRGQPSPFGLAFEVLDQSRRAPLAAEFRRVGIDCRLPTGGSFLRHPYASRWADEQQTPEADRIHDCGMFLGNAPWPIPDLVEKAIGVMQRVL